MPSRPLRAPAPPVDLRAGRVASDSVVGLTAAPARALVRDARLDEQGRGTRRRRRQRTTVVQAALTLPALNPAVAPAWRTTAKRSLDVVGALVGLVVGIPVLLALAVAVKLASPGPVLFGQRRIGQRGRHFRCLKLRTMCADAETRLAADDDLRAAYEANHFKVPAHADPRVTALGRFLRTTSLDEMPQFWNVLRGDMSLVGPRPIVEAELEEHYGPARTLLLSVKPGLTGAWAVEGRSRIGYPVRARIELEYARTWSLRGDLTILLRTVGVVLQRRGAY